VIDSRNAFIMNSMMQSVIRNGTAAKALKLGRSDIAGKTGTTNDHIDAWFAGYSPKQVAIAWVGFDTPKPLGRGETGAAAALPIWIKYMATALKGTPEMAMRMPDGVVAMNVDPTTGTRDESGVTEYFYHENPPPLVEADLPPLLDGSQNPDEPGGNSPLTNQPQQILQPEIVLPAKPAPTTPNPPPSSGHSDAQSNAARLLNTH